MGQTVYILTCIWLKEKVEVLSSFLLVLFKNKSPPYVKKFLLNFTGKTHLNKSKIIQSLNVVVRSQITRVTGNQGVAWLTAEILSAKHFSYVLKCREQGEIQEKNLKELLSPLWWLTQKSLGGRRVGISWSTGKIMAVLSPLHPFLVQSLHETLLYNVLFESLHSSGPKDWKSFLQQESSPGLSWDPGRQLQLCQTWIPKAISAHKTSPWLCWLPLQAHNVLMLPFKSPVCSGTI